MDRKEYVFQRRYSRATVSIYAQMFLLWLMLMFNWAITPADVNDAKNVLLGAIRRSVNESREMKAYFDESMEVDMLAPDWYFSTCVTMIFALTSVGNVLFAFTRRQYVLVLNLATQQVAELLCMLGVFGYAFVAFGQNGKSVSTILDGLLRTCGCMFFAVLFSSISLDLVDYRLFLLADEEDKKKNPRLNAVRVC